MLSGSTSTLKSLKTAPLEEKAIPQLSTEEELALLQGRGSLEHFLREDVCGACGIRHPNPSLLDLYANCSNCLNCVRQPCVLRNRYKGIVQLAKLEIVFATYGHPSDSRRAVDVTTVCNAIADNFSNRDRISFKSSMDLECIFGDPAPHMPKQLCLRYRMNSKFAVVKCDVLPNNHLREAFLLLAPTTRLLTVLRASYGHPKGRSTNGRMSYDVTEIVQGLVDRCGGSYLSIPSDKSVSALFSDPCPGYPKDLIIEYDIDGQSSIVTLDVGSGYLRSSRDVCIKKLAVISPLIFVESAFYGVTPTGRKEKLAELSRLLSTIDVIEYRMRLGLPVSEADTSLKRRKSAIQEEQVTVRNLETSFIDISSALQKSLEQTIFFLDMAKESFDPNKAFSNVSPGKMKLLEINLRVVGHDSERRTSSSEITASGFPRNYISGSAARFLVVVTDGEDGRGVLESSIYFSARLTFPPIMVHNAAYGYLKNLSQVIDVTREVQGLIDFEGLKIPTSLNLDRLFTNPCAGCPQKQLRIQYSARGICGCLRVRESNDKLMGSVQLGYRPVADEDLGEANDS